MKEEDKDKIYDTFIRSGLGAGFTDDQIDFLWEWIYGHEIKDNLLTQVKE